MLDINVSELPKTRTDPFDLGVSYAYPALGHEFDSYLVCSWCKIAWHRHQKAPALCPGRRQAMTQWIEHPELYRVREKNKTYRTKIKDLEDRLATWRGLIRRIVPPMVRALAKRKHKPEYPAHDCSKFDRYFEVRLPQEPPPNQKADDGK